MTGVLLAASVVSGCATPTGNLDNAGATREVEARERAFAATMARRDFEAFRTFLADETIFMSGTRTLRGKEQVANAWRRFYEGPKAPFSWEPDHVEVVDSGTLAFSTGPVRDPEGRLVARFQSIWRLEAAGNWRIVIDKGVDICNCAGPGTP